MSAATELTAVRDGYIAQLKADAESSTPGVDYSLDGKRVTRSVWRRSIMEQIDDLNRMIAQLSPGIVVQRKVPL